MFSKFLLLFVFRKFNASIHCRFSKHNQIHDRPPTTESKRTIFRCKIRLLCDAFQPKKIFFYEIFLSFSPSTLRLASKSNCSRPFYRRFFSLSRSLLFCTQWLSWRRLRGHSFIKFSNCSPFSVSCVAFLPPSLWQNEQCQPNHYHFHFTQCFGLISKQPTPLFGGHSCGRWRNSFISSWVANGWCYPRYSGMHTSTHTHKKTYFEIHQIHIALNIFMKHLFSHLSHSHSHSHSRGMQWNIYARESRITDIIWMGNEDWWRNSERW